MKPNKFTEIRKRLAYIQDLLDEAIEVIKEAELVDDINRKVGVDESVLLVGTTVSDVDEYDDYSLEDSKQEGWFAWIPAICIVGIFLLLILLSFVL